MKIFSIVLVFIVTAYQSVIATEVDDIEKLVEEKIKIVIQLIKNKEMDEDTRNQKIIDVTMPIIDFERMVKLSIGRSTWLRISSAQKKAFMDIFLKRLQETYLDKLNRYTDEKVIMKGAKRDGNRIRVETDLITKVGHIEIVYKFLKSKNEWKAYDAEILGISIVSIYRRQFFYYLKFNSFDRLIERFGSQSQIW